MSELFKALQKLEEQNGSEVSQPFSASSGRQAEKSPRPYLKSILLCGLLLLLTLSCLGFLWFGRDYFTPSSPMATKSSVAVKEDQLLPKAKPVSIPQTKQISAEAEETLLPEPVNIVEVDPILPDETTSPQKPVSTTQHNIMEGSILSVAPLTIRQEVQLQTVSLEQFIASSTDEMEKEQNRNRQRKRIVYQAEKMREENNLAQALTLYKKAWLFGPNPGLANNLAAILIQSRQYEEAEEYLKQAISLAPDDEDLRYNLNIAQEGRKRKKMPLAKQQ